MSATAPDITAGSTVARYQFPFHPGVGVRSGRKVGQIFHLEFSVCDQECKSLQDLQKHKEEKHATMEEFKCGVSERYLKNQRNLQSMRKHMKSFHVSMSIC